MANCEEIFLRHFMSSHSASDTSLGQFLGNSFFSHLSFLEIVFCRLGTKGSCREPVRSDCATGRTV